MVSVGLTVPPAFSVIVGVAGAVLVMNSNWLPESVYVGAVPVPGPAALKVRLFSLKGGEAMSFAVATAALAFSVPPKKSRVSIPLTGVASQNVPADQFTVPPVPAAGGGVSVIHSAQSGWGAETGEKGGDASGEDTV